VTLLITKTKHFKIVRQSLVDQIFDCFHIIYGIQSRFDHRYDYFLLGHHVERLRIDTYAPLISTGHSCPKRQGTTRNARRNAQSNNGDQ
jgi:hypothetical protein